MQTQRLTCFPALGKKRWLLLRCERCEWSYDIQLFDERVRKEYKLDDLRLGDVVAIKMRITLTGEFTSMVPYQWALLCTRTVFRLVMDRGYNAFTSSTGKITQRIDAKANIASIPRLRTDI